MSQIILYLKVICSKQIISLRITRDRFPKIWDLLQGLKIGVPSGCLGETSIFKIIMIMMTGARKMQDRKMTDQITGGKKCRTGIWRAKSQGLTIAGPENDGPNKPNLSQYVHWVVTAYKWTKSLVHCSCGNRWNLNNSWCNLGSLQTAVSSLFDCRAHWCRLCAVRPFSILWKLRRCCCDGQRLSTVRAVHP